MNKLINKINKFFSYLTYFPLRISLAQMLLRLHKCNFTVDLCHRQICNYLKHNYAHVIEKYKNQSQPEVGIPDDAPIFMLWFQGEEQMPPIVRTCYERAKRFCQNHPVILLTRENLKNFIDIPQIVYDKLEAGKIKVQYLSDIIRNMLISKYDCIWMDATIYISTPPPPEFLSYNRPYFTMHGKMRKNWHWTSYFFIGAKNNILNSFLADLLLDYAVKEERQLDYFMFDYAFEVGYDCVPAIKQLIDSIPETNPDRNYIAANQQKPLNLEEFLEVQKGTHIFKCNWKRPSNDPNSLYQYLVTNN